MTSCAWTTTRVRGERLIQAGSSQDEDFDSESFQVHVGDDEKIGNSDLEQDDKEEDSPKDSFSYEEAISKLRSRLGPSICPLPEAKNTKVGASALDFFKDPDQTEEILLALPQSNCVSLSFSRMNKRLKGEEEVAMTPLPSNPKGFKAGSFVSLNSKPKIFQASSYESLNRGLKDVKKQNTYVPTSHTI